MLFLCELMLAISKNEEVTIFDQSSICLPSWSCSGVVLGILETQPHNRLKVRLSHPQLCLLLYIKMTKYGDC